MPMFRTQPSYGLTNSMRSILQGGQLGPLGEIQAAMTASRMSHESALAEKARLESEQLRAEQSMREDPAAASAYAGNVARISPEQSTEMARYVAGAIVPNQQGTGPDVMGTPERARIPENMRPGAADQYQTAIASLIGNQVATGKTNAAQLAQAGSTLNKEGLVSQAANTPDIPAANRINAAVGSHVQRPYTSGQAGTLDTATGKLTDTALARSVRELKGAQGSAATARAAQVRAGKPATQVAPERVQRMIDMSTKDEHSMLVKQWEAIKPISVRKATPRPTVADARANVEKRYRGNGTPQDPGMEGDMGDAQQALEGGADPDQVAARFKQRWGHDLGDLIDLSEYD